MAMEAKPPYKAQLDVILNALEAADSNHVIYCSPQSGFNLGLLTEGEEKRFRNLLMGTEVGLISIPIGRKKKRYKDLFEDGKFIAEVKRDKNRHSVMFVPPKIFQRTWCRNGKAPAFAIVIS